MKNKNLIRMTSLLGVLTMAGCSLPNSFINNEVEPTLTNTSSTTVTAEMPANFSGEQKAPEANMIPGEEELNALSNASLNVFYETIESGENGENVLISPASLAFAMAITENGANGDTLAQMEKYVNGGISIEDMNALLNYTSYKLNNAEDVEWGVANSLWFNDNGDCEIENDFLKKAIEYYDAEVYKKAFDASTANEINKWVYNKTNKMIDEVIRDFSPDAMLFIVNAIAFEGEWAEEYEKSQVLENREFTNADRSTSNCTMLSSTEDRYFTLGEGTGFIKPYKGGEYSFVGILPEEGVSPEEYIKDLVKNNEDFSKAVREAEYGDVYVTMPEFTTDYGNEGMVDVYKKMGMDLPFDPGKADLKGIFTNDSDSDVWIGKIIHKTHIEVDRQGTRAAAVTVVEVDKCMAVAPTSDPVVIDLDRPFVYAIVDNETGVPVFLGCMNNMQ
ncbi:MAG: serpin family protein [Lachnospiraceae bacterium]|nr:serpin family protein [Lachnospiraceae bacterium]